VTKTASTFLLTFYSCRSNKACFQCDEVHPFEREFRGILKYEPVSRTHDGFVQVLHVGRNDQAGCFYYVMELADPAKEKNISAPVTNDSRSAQADASPADGRITDSLTTDYSPRALRSEILRRGRLPPSDAAQFAVQLVGALAHLHSHGLVHDVKPSNVIFVNGCPKLADIGLVTAAGSSNSYVGTEGFVPPEGPGTPQADLYALGKMLYEIVTSRDRMDFPQLPPGFMQWPERDAIAELNEVVTRACAPNPQNRYLSAEQFQAELNLFLAGHSLSHARRLEVTIKGLKRFAAVA
jgi:serine/threonine protein kinase